MSDQTQNSSSSSNSFLAFVVGGLVVAVVVLGWMLYGGDLGGSDDLTISIEGGGEAVEAIEGAVSGSE